MKNQILTFFFLAFLCQSLFAQNWQPLMRNDIYNYKHKHSLFITQSVWVDSFAVQNADTTFYLNLIANHITDNLPYDCSDGIVRRLPHFLQKEAIKQANGEWTFQNPNTYYLKPMAQLNDSWLFDPNTTATIIQIDTIQVAGQIDSLKKILLSTGDSIFLSKNYGLLRFPTFDNTFYIEWAGIQTRSLGDTIFHYRDIFNFEIGDIFYYDVFISSIWNGNAQNKYQKIKMTITQKTDGIDTLYYSYHWETQTFQYGNYSFTNGNTLLFFHQGDKMPYNAYPRQYTGGWGSYAIMDSGSTFNYPIKNFPYGYIDSDNSDTIWGGDCFESGRRSNMKYSKGLGLIHSGRSSWYYGGGSDSDGYITDTTLVGYIKNGISVGTIYPDWQFTGVEFPQTPLFSLSPNPAKEQLSITLSKENNFNIRIWDIQGREKLAIYSPNNSTTININNWAKGIYFVEVEDEEGNRRVEKWVKE